jgi:hypothetical protein
MCSFQNDKCLAFCLDSRYRDARDCYRIEVSEDSNNFKLVPADQIVSGETKHMALAIWQERQIVILLNKEGAYPNFDLGLFSIRGTSRGM